MPYRRTKWPVFLQNSSSNIFISKLSMKNSFLVNVSSWESKIVLQQDGPASHPAKLVQYYCTLNKQSSNKKTRLF